MWRASRVVRNMPDQFEINYLSRLSWLHALYDPKNQYFDTIQKELKSSGDEFNSSEESYLDKMSYLHAVGDPLGIYFSKELS